MFASKGVEHGRLPISPGMNWKAPKLQIHGIIETAIYVEDLDESEAFYPDGHGTDSERQGAGPL